MKVNFGWLVNILKGLVRPLFSLLSETIRQQLVDWLDAFRKKCQLTENPWDDYLADFLCELFEVE